jgi:ribose/xylose/arabinose/galactoside ABC-type transport system permease subunit
VLQYGVYVSLAALLLIALLVTPEVYSGESLSLMLRSAAQLGIVAIGQTLVLLVAGLDLSVGGVIFVANVVIADVTNGSDALLPGGILVALGVGALIGLANSLLVTRRNVPPFVATLGILVLINGAVNAYTKGIPSGFVPKALGIFNQSVGPFPIPFILWIIFTLIVAFLLSRTPWGRQIYAVGSNTEAARLSGVRVDLVRISAYVLCSLMACVGGIILSGYVGYVDKTLGNTFDLDSIAAAIVGGTAFTGGRGNLLGTAAGVLLIELLQVMVLRLGLDIQVQLLVKGFVIVAAVALYSVAARQR